MEMLDTKEEHLEAFIVKWDLREIIEPTETHPAPQEQVNSKSRPISTVISMTAEHSSL